MSPPQRRDAVGSGRPGRDPAGRGARRGSWQWRMRVRHRWHQRWHRHHAEFNHSLAARLITVFVLLAMLAVGILWAALRLHHGLVWAVPLLLVVVTVMVYGAVRHLIAPLRALAAGAEAFGRGDLAHRVPIYHHDEIGDLAHRFNTMAADIQAMLDGKRALLLAISHELRSPLTRARLHAEMVDDGPSKTQLLGELVQMRDLISSLIETERLGSGHRALHLTDAHLGDMAREHLQPGVVVHIDDGLPGLPLDRTRVQLLLRNLVHNALRHNDGARGPVDITVRRVASGVQLAVRDHGPGVPPDVLPRLGQPFYRPDEARTRDSGGAGLGLSLCRLIAQAHGTSLALRNAAPGFEASVTFRLGGEDH